MILINIVNAIFLMIFLFLSSFLNEIKTEEHIEAILISYSNTLINNNELPNNFEDMGISDNFFQKHKIKAYNYDENFKNLRNYEDIFFYTNQRMSFSTKKESKTDYKIKFHNEFYIMIDDQIYNAYILSCYAMFNLKLIERRQMKKYFLLLGIHANYQAKLLNKII